MEWSRISHLDTTGQIKILPPKTAEEMVLRERERKARTTLLMSHLPKDHLLNSTKYCCKRYSGIAIKSRFGGNDESKKTGNNPVNTVKASGTNNVSTARQNINKQTVLTSTALKVNTVKPSVNDRNSTQKLLKNKGIIDSGCSRHMTGNKAYLADYQDINGGPVAFGGSRGYITGKDFKLPDENQILLKVPRQNNMYSFNLENIVPLGGLACLIAKATFDESNLWHRRLGHVNFKNLNRLVKGNLVRGLPTKLFQNDHTCVACQKGKQHKASCKAKLVSSISHTLQLLHMDLFGPTSIRSINHKTYCLVITDDFSRFSWTFFLRSKDETRNINDSVGLKGSRREYSNAKTPPTKWIAERKEQDLIDACTNHACRFILYLTLLAEAGKDQTRLFDLDYLTDSMNYLSVSSENQTNIHAGQQATNQNEGSKDKIDSGNSQIEDESAQDCFEVPYWHSYSSTNNSSSKSDEKRRSPREEEQVFLDDLARLQRQEKEANEEAEALIRNHDQDTEKSNTQAEAERLSDSNMDVKSAFLYGKIDEEVYVSQPPGFLDPKYPEKVYKVVKALYGLHQAPRAWYATLSTFLLKNGYRRGTIDKTLFLKKDKHDIILVQVYVDDIIFGSTKKSWCDEFEALMKSRFQMSSMGELTFFLGLQVKQKPNGIFISQDKYVAEILKKFDFASVKTASTPIETQKPLVKDEEASDVDVHLYRSMIGSLMYVTASRPDIMFAVCACSRFQVTPKTSHLSAVKRIFRYLKGKPKLGLWYPRVSSFDLESYSDSDYAGANLDRKSTTGGCQFLGRRLITWQCKKQTIVATSTTEAEYVAAASCCGQVLWIQNQMLDYGFNFMNTKIYIDNESTICIVKNPVYHSKTKHIAIRHHFIRDAYEKKLIQSKKIAQVVRAWIKSKNSLVKHFEDMRLYRPSKEYLQVKLVKVMLVNALRRFRESLRRVTDGAEAFLILTLFILCLDKVSTDHAKLVPLGKVCTAEEFDDDEKYRPRVTKCPEFPTPHPLSYDDFPLLKTMVLLSPVLAHMIAYLDKD
ncbi:putative ribonuclease H-like domain-containing protein [Tanacetum coccineum]|uniref:Ribonuclease H-like domain-containing protein n=1 Tax=Tanacetum coccineum TaxID=301880 RepID=A0ABQ5IQQ6_9ASTR